MSEQETKHYLANGNETLPDARSSSISAPAAADDACHARLMSLARTALIRVSTARIAIWNALAGEYEELLRRAEPQRR